MHYVETRQIWGIAMKKIVLIFILIFLTSSPVYAWWEVRYDTTETYHDNGQLKERWYSAYDTGSEEGFKKHGQYTRWDEDGVVVEVGDYHCGFKNGLWIKFYPDGKYKEVSDYSNDKLHGCNLEYYPDHLLKKHFYFKDGVPHGFCYTCKPGIEPLNSAWIDYYEKAEFYLNGKMIFSFDASQDNLYWPEFDEKTGAFYNSEADLYIQFDSRNWTFDIGEMTGGQKDGLWILYEYSGAIRKIDYYVDGTPQENWSVMDLNNPPGTSQRGE